MRLREGEAGGGGGGGTLLNGCSAVHDGHSNLVILILLKLKYQLLGKGGDSGKWRAWAIVNCIFLFCSDNSYYCATQQSVNLK